LSVGDVIKEGAYACAVESHAIDQALVSRQPEDARLRIAGLGPRGHAADLDAAEPEPGETVEVVRIFIEPGCKPDRVGKFEAHYRQRLVYPARRQQAMKLLQHFQADVVCQFGIDREQQGFDQ